MTQRPETYQDVRIEDVDRAIYEWFDRHVDAHVNIGQGGRMKVPVIFSNRERWVSSHEDVAHRDKDGRIVLPVISITRTGIDPTNGMLALGSNVPRLQVARRVSQKTNTLVNNHIARGSLSVTPKPVVYDVVTIPFPFNGTAPYQMVIQTQYMEHMNAILERIMAELEFYDVPCFVAPMRGDGLPGGVGPSPGELQDEEEVPYEQRELGDCYYVCGYMDDAMSSEGNIDEFTDQERILRYTGHFTVPVFLQLNPPDKREAVQVEQTAFKVDFGREGVHFSDDPYDIELLFSGRTIVEKVKRR